MHGQLPEWFEVYVVVIQGCLLSPKLLNIFLKCVMKELS